MTSKYRFLVPNSVTFLSLACGFVSILASASGNLRLGGSLILASYILDLLDGELARKLDARSEFGLQLDSLVDIVSLGTAPAVLLFFYMESQSFNMIWVWPFVIVLPLAGAYRLARFNVGPPKTSKSGSVGLTISTAGAFLTLAVLSELSLAEGFIPTWLFIPLMALVSFLMVSRIRFPAFRQVFARRRLNYVLLFVVALSLIRLSLVNVWFIFTSIYVGFGLMRAGYMALNDG